MLLNLAALLLLLFGLQLVVGWLFQLVEGVLELVDERNQGLLVACLRLLEVLGDRVVVIVHQVSVVGFLGACALDPATACLQH